MKNQVLVDLETKAALRSDYNCTDKAVREALKFESNSSVAKSIRISALERGGRVAGGYVPHCETVHDTVNRVMVNYFTSRIKLTSDFKTGEVTVTIDGKTDAVYHNLSIGEFMQLQWNLERKAVAL